MFRQSSIPFDLSGTLNPLVSDYLAKKETTRDLYDFFPDHDGYKKWLETDPYSDFDHARLSKLLLAQAALVNNTSGKSTQNILNLAKKNSYTVTTGHQLCLFTGPLYFIYKIVSAITLAERLKKEFPGSEFVPVYWMASEDHDFAEVNHFHHEDRTLEWNSSQAGAVGEFETAELRRLLPEIKSTFGISDNATELINLFENAYLKHATLADATRFLVNELFGEFGIVTIDGNDPNLKSQFKDYFREDIFKNSPYEQVAKTTSRLTSANYHVQVNPRPINCFYMRKGQRTRIEKQENVYTIVGTDQSFTADEIEAMIESDPSKLSPNVVLRPVYQQVILPNIAYVGGPGELAYWLQFKGMFDAMKVRFPVLVPRNFITILDLPVLKRMSKLGIKEKDIFKSAEQLLTDLQILKGKVFHIEDYQRAISKILDKLKYDIASADKTLVAAAEAELHRSLKALDKICFKANRSLKRQLDTEARQMGIIKTTLFPGGIPQERHQNFSPFYLRFGRSFFSAIKENTDPFLFSHIVLAEA